MRSIFPVTLLGLLTAATLLPAQSVKKIYYPDNAASTGGCNAIPFGTGTSATWANQKYQVVVPSSAFGKKVGMIQTLGFAACNTASRSFDSLVIRMDYFQGTGTTMSTTFASNISNKAVTVLSLKKHTWQRTGNTWSRVGLQVPFLYIPQKGHLIIEIESRGSTGPSSPQQSCRTGAVQRVYAYNTQWTNGQPPAVGRTSSSSALKMEIGFDAPAVDTFGVGCPGSNKTTPKIKISGSASLGGKVSIGLAGALAKAPAFFVAAPRVLPAPFNMGAIGAPSCLLYVPPDFLSTVVTDASGNHTQTVTLPKAPIFLGVRLYGQYLPFDKKANAFGASASDYARAMLGS